MRTSASGKECLSQTNNCETKNGGIRFFYFVHHLRNVVLAETQDFHLRQHLTNQSCRLDPVHPGHDDVHDYDIRSKL
jgi:hypothetical protein